MSAVAPPAWPSPESAEPTLEQYVQNFDRQPAVCRAEIAKLLDKDPRAFYDGVIQILRSGGGPARGMQLLAALLVSGGLIGPALMDPSLSLRQAIALGQLALQQDANLDMTLAKRLTEDPAATADTQRAGRLLDVLAAISSGARVTAFLMRLMRHSDPVLRSKTVLLIGRNSRSVKWVQSRLSESDPRTRASAIEALWGVDTAEARELLRASARDGNNRVAGNALIALLRLGDLWAIPEVVKMAALESSLFRASAAWVMGESGDPRFREPLARLVGEADAMVRRRAFQALSRLKAAAQARTEPYRVAGRILRSGGNWRQVRLEVASGDGRAPELVPTNFLFFEDEKPVAQYQIEHKPSPEAMAISLILPRTPSGAGAPWVQGATAALQWKRTSDLWQMSFYLSPGEGREGAVDADAGPSFLPGREAIAAALAEPPGKIECSDFWSAIRRGVDPLNAPARGTRQLIVVVAEEIATPESLTTLISAAINSRAAVHAIARTHSAPLEDLCTRSSGSYVTVASDVELPSMIEATHVAMLSRFHIAYLPSGPGGGMFQVKVHNATGSGEAFLPAP